MFGSRLVELDAGFFAFRKSSRSCFLCCWLRCSPPLVAGRPWWWRCCVSQRSSEGCGAWNCARILGGTARNHSIESFIGSTPP